MMPEESESERIQGLALTDIARLAEVGVSAVSNWRKRHPGFPSPVLVSGQELFAMDQIAAWLSQRKIPRNALHPDEAQGATYGDRVIRNGGLPVPGAQARQSHLVAPAPHAWTQQLWQVMDLLRGDLEAVSAVDFIMAMLYLRKINPELWRAVAEQTSWSAVHSLVRDVPLDHDVPLFPAIASDFSDDQNLMEAVRLFNEVEITTEGAGSVFDALLDRVNRDLGRNGGHFTPSSVVRCMVEVLGPQSSSTVYDPSCGSGELLAAAAQSGAQPVFGQAMNARSLRMTLFNLAMHDSDAELQIGGPEVLRGAFPGEQFDVILTNPPFNMALPSNAELDAWPFDAPAKQAANFAWLQIAVYKLKAGGQAGVLMPNGTLFTGGQNAEIRRKMIEAGVVEGIIALPAGLFVGTGIAVSLWLLRRPESGKSLLSEVLFVDATSLGAASGRAQRVLREDEIARIAQAYCSWRDSGDLENFDSAGFARSAGIEEIRQNDYDLQPLRYVRKDIGSRATLAETSSTKIVSLQSEMDALVDQVTRSRSDVEARLNALRRYSPREFQRIPLGEVAEIQAGPGAVERERGLMVQSWMPLVLPRNIKSGYISHDALDTVTPEISAKLAKYQLREGDIVCARSGTLGRHALVGEAERGWLVGPSCMRIKPNADDVIPEYLVHYLNSPEVHQWLMAESRGTAIPHISSAKLRELVVPLPPVAVQGEIASMLSTISVHIEQHQRAVSTMQSLRDLVFPSIIRTQKADEQL